MPGVCADHFTYSMVTVTLQVIVIPWMRKQKLRKVCYRISGELDLVLWLQILHSFHHTINTH